MKVIFLEDIPRVGKRYEIKEVNDGYAINFLFPKKLAEPATKEAIKKLEQKQKEIQIEKEIQLELLEKSLKELKDKVVILKVKADEKGHLFSGIHKKEIVEALEKEHRAKVGEEFLILEKPIKEIGEFEIPVEIKNKKSSLKLLIEKL